MMWTIQSFKCTIKEDIIVLVGKKMDITIVKLHDKDLDQLFEFELENRNYFEEMVWSRGDDYYHFETFITKNQALLDEQSQGLSHFYLIKNKNGLIVGRINLVDIDKTLGSGHIGYRVGKAYAGRGVAKKALQLLLKTMNKQEIKQIEGKTSTNNIASQKILEHNGFKHVSTSDEEFEMHGQRLKFVYYKWTI